MRCKVFEFTLENPVLVSTNDMYRHPVRKTKNGRYVSFFTKTEDLIEMQDFYKEVLQEKISDEVIQQIKDALETDHYDGLELYISLGYTSGLYTEDISNYIKALEDCIVKRTKIDDSKNLMVSATKYNTTSESPVLYVSMYLTKLSDIEIFINNIKQDPIETII